MRCAEFESRLNVLLDERVEPAADAVLTDHAERCPQCAELVASHELLLEGTRLLPKVQLRPGESEMLGRRVVAAVAVEGPPFRHETVELADRQPLAMASRRGPALAVISACSGNGGGSADCCVTVVPKRRCAAAEPRAGSRRRRDGDQV